MRTRYKCLKFFIYTCNKHDPLALCRVIFGDTEYREKIFPLDQVVTFNISTYDFNGEFRIKIPSESLYSMAYKKFHVTVSKKGRLYR